MARSERQNGQRSQAANGDTPPEAAQLPAGRLLVGRLSEPSQRNPCPTCAAPVDQSSNSYPFCSHRCRLADLNKWFSEDYKLSRPIEQSDIEEGD